MTKFVILFAFQESVNSKNSELKGKQVSTSCFGKSFVFGALPGTWGGFDVSVRACDAIQAAIWVFAHMTDFGKFEAPPSSNAPGWVVS